MLTCHRIFAGFHTDLNFLTIHGQSRYPGLHIWARNSGKRIEVKIPPGCLLVQAGKQLEWMTGGLIKGQLSEVRVELQLTRRSWISRSGMQPTDSSSMRS